MKQLSKFSCLIVTLYSSYDINFEYPAIDIFAHAHNGSQTRKLRKRWAGVPGPGLARRRGIPSIRANKRTEQQREEATRKMTCMYCLVYLVFVTALALGSETETLNKPQTEPGNTSHEQGNL